MGKLTKNHHPDNRRRPTLPVNRKKMKKNGISFPKNKLKQDRVHDVCNEAIEYYNDTKKNRDVNNPKVTIKTVLDRYQKMGYDWMFENQLTQRIKYKKKKNIQEKKKKQQQQQEQEEKQNPQEEKAK